MKPYILPAQLSALDHVCKWFSIAGGILLLAWWTWPSLIPVRFGRALLLIFGLSGCASFGYQWEQTRAPSVKPWLYVTVTDTDFACRSAGADLERRLSRINACAQWKPIGCVIYIPENAPRWMIEHEERHCMGEQH